MKNYTGARSGCLIAISFAYIKSKKTYWNFKCDCGSDKVIRICNVFSGKTKSCGCLNHLTKTLIPSVDKSFKELIRVYKKSAKERNLMFDISDKIIYETSQQNCHYCGSVPFKNIIVKNHLPFIYNGIDRKDNNIGYLINNILPCCEICNKAKRNLSYIDFIDWIKKIKKHNIL